MDVDLPNRPSNSKVDLFSWIITAEKNRKIFVTLNGFHYYYYYYGNDDGYVLLVGDGNVTSSDAGIFFKWEATRYRNPPDLLSTHNTMWMKWRPPSFDRWYNQRVTFSSVPSTGDFFFFSYVSHCIHFR